MNKFNSANNTTNDNQEKPSPGSILYNSGTDNLEDYKEIKEAVKGFKDKLTYPGGKLAPAYAPVKNNHNKIK